MFILIRYITQHSDGKYYLSQSKPIKKYGEWKIETYYDFFRFIDVGLINDDLIKKIELSDEKICYLGDSCLLESNGFVSVKLSGYII